MEDAWYELEGAYEVYGIGRCRFVLFHCRMAMHIGLSLLAKSKGTRPSKGGIDAAIDDLGISNGLAESCLEVEKAGRYHFPFQKAEDEQELAAAVLSRTLEIIEWITEEMDRT